MKKVAIAGFMMFGPMLALAAVQSGSTGGTYLEGILVTIKNIFNTLIPILITLGVIYFIWGVIQYVTAADEEKKTKARSTMISGVIGLFVIIAIWGLVGILTNTFLGGDNGSVQNSQLPCIGGGCPN